MTATDELSRVFAALADPTRRDILARLGAGEATAGELAAPYAISQPAVSRHLKVLQRAGLVLQTPHAQWRTHHLQTQPLSEAGAWIEHVTSLWSARLDRLDAHLKTQPNRQKKRKPR